MNISKKTLEKSQLELQVTVAWEEFKPFVEKGARKLSEKVKVEGFRPGKIPYEILKQKVGELAILEEAANIIISSQIDKVLGHDNLDGYDVVGQPRVEISKLAPENELGYKVVVSLVPEVKLGKYKDLGIKEEEVKVDDKEIDKAMADFQAMRAKETISAEPIKLGDRVIADINISVGGVPVEGGQQKAVSVLIGKKYFVDGFDEKLIGAKNGDSLEFSLEYPEKYHQLALAGKKADFKVEIKGVFQRELPALDDNFAKMFQFKTIGEMKQAMADNAKQEKARQYANRLEAEMFDKITSSSDFGYIPEVLIENELRSMLSELEQSVVRQGGDFKDYLQHIGKTKEQLMVDFSPNAMKRVKSALVIRTVAKQDKIEVTHEEVEKKIAELKELYKDNKQVSDMMDEHSYFHYLESVMLNEKVIGKLKEWNYARSSAKQES